ncbi:MAG: hypothetical protein ACK4JF_09600 [Methylohalobius sp.]
MSRKTAPLHKEQKPHREAGEANTLLLEPEAERPKVRIPPPPIPGRTFWSLAPLPE